MALRLFLLMAAVLAAEENPALIQAEKALATGRYAEATAKAHEALAACERLGDLKGSARSWNTIGLAQVYQGSYRDAIESYEAALRFDRRAGDAEGETMRLYNLGNARVYLGQYQEAFRLYRAAQEKLDSASGDWVAKRRPIVAANLANLYQRLGRYRQALDLYLELSSGIGRLRKSDQAQVLANLGTLYRRLGDPVKALESYQEAQRLYAGERHTDGEIAVLKNLGIIHALDLDRMAEAIGAFRRALALAEQAGAGQVPSSQLHLAEALRRVGQHEQARGYFEQALAGAERQGQREYIWRAMFGLGQLAEASAAEAALRLYGRAIEQIEAVREEAGPSALRRQFLADKRDVYDAALRATLAQPRARAEDIFALMEQSRGRMFQDRAGRSSLRQLQARLPAGTLLLEYWMTEDQGALLRVTRHSATVERLRNAKREQVARLGAAGGDWRRVSEELGAALLGGWLAEGNGAVAHVVVVPDGPLHLLPFEALTVKGPGGKRQLLIEAAAVSYLPTAALAGSGGRSAAAWRWPWQVQMVAFADPAARSPERWAPLPKSREEVRTIAGYLPGRTEIHVGAGAQKRYLPAAGNYAPLLHLGTHARVDAADVENSRILFAPAAAAEEADYLFLREVYSADWRGLDLVVASACETETGKLLGGEGMEGFGRAFLAAGARSAVTTLWRVEDSATAEFMKHFYANLGSGKPKAAALREAKLRFLGSGSRLAAPEYWGGFVLFGEGFEAIPRHWSWGEAGLGAAELAALAAVCLWLRRRMKANRLSVPPQ